MARRDPVEAREDGTRDLYGIARWEVRTPLDRLAVRLYRSVLSTARLVVVLLAVSILLAEVALGGLGAVSNPVIGAFTLLSAVPAFLLAAYVWRADATASEPLGTVVVTFLLGILVAGFAGVLNTMFGPLVPGLGAPAGPAASLGLAVFFYVVVGPVEEGVKLLAVALYAYRSVHFDAVVDGAVYGAAAGLGFATIENALYITGNLDTLGAGSIVGAGGALATVRALAGPGHVIYSAFAGYYLGLAKFNRSQAGPIVLKGLLVAAFLHGTYNTLVSFVPQLGADLLGVSPLAAFFGLVVVYDGVLGLLLYRKLASYWRAYRALHPEAADLEPELTEFDPGGGARRTSR